MAKTNNIPHETLAFLKDPIHNNPDYCFEKTCYSLWGKNIYTIQSFFDKGYAVIMLHELDEENTEIFNSLCQINNVNYFYFI